MRKEKRNIKKIKSRNDPCWCGSGLKNKKCHNDREHMKPPTIQEIKEKFSKNYGKEYCLCPISDKVNCSGDIIKAHSVQKSGVLDKIALNGHVYEFDYSFTGLVKNNDNVIVKKTGINKASTFTGFCGYHDNKIFETLDNYTYSTTNEFAFLMGYRAITRELFVKSAQKKMFEFMREMDKGKDITSQVRIQMEASTNILGSETGLRDLESEKKIFDDALLNKDFSKVKYLIINLSNTPEYVCSGAIYPEHDFSGAQLQDLSNLEKKMDLLTFSIISNQSGGAIVFAWLENSKEACEKFVKSLNAMNNTDLLNALTRFIFITTENLFFSIDWWDNLSKNDKEKLLDRFNRATDDFDYWSPDGINAINWVITSRDVKIT